VFTGGSSSKLSLPLPHHGEQASCLPVSHTQLGIAFFLLEESVAYTADTMEANLSNAIVASPLSTHAGEDIETILDSIMELEQVRA
jgi:enoyl-[acyl-carrier-protein] reductase (NADH)